jgi:hypothetical protein
MAINDKYKPSETKSRSWEEIELFYNDLISRGWPLQDMILLVQYIRNDCNLNQKLFACTSLDKLVIGIYNPVELDREALHIHYEKEKKLWNFKYYPYPYHDIEHERNYPGELLVEKFQSYTDMLKW